MRAAGCGAPGLLERQGGDRVERGYLLLPDVFEQEANGDWAAAAAIAGEAAAIGERFGDPDLFALAAHEQGEILIKLGRLDEGLGLLDEAMVALTAGELYCGVILACQDAYEIRRAREWTAALISAWCARQPHLVAFTGRCLVHGPRSCSSRARSRMPSRRRAARPSAACRGRTPRRRARRVTGKGRSTACAATSARPRRPIGRQAGSGESPSRAFPAATRPGRARRGCDRDAQGRRGDSRSRRAGGDPPRLHRDHARGRHVEAARGACRELESIAEGQEAGALGALAARARGTIDLAAGDAAGALTSLRRAGEIWQQLKAPYETARVRELAGRACHLLGDEDTAALELEAARAAYAEPGASPDLARLRSLGGGPRGDVHGLTERELEVLRHLAAGETNKAIAAELVVSERTVDRHVSNIFAKLGVSSRTAATTYAYQHRLL